MKIYDNTKKLKILGQTFEVEETEFNDEGNNITFGESVFVSNKIKINRKIKEERKEITLIHMEYAEIYLTKIHGRISNYERYKKKRLVLGRKRTYR